MGQVAAHRQRYETFLRDAGWKEISPELRVEALFLGAYQVIEAVAAISGLHIGKHQNVRKYLEANPYILGSDTEEVWRAFQDLETRIRPKFVYGQKWEAEDLERADALFVTIERICQKRLAK